MYVSRGIGTTGLPIRFAAPPEIAVLRLASSG
jgi:predicted MPP superfamily phosphohydrolase